MTLFLLCAVTLLYAAYNLLIKTSSLHVPEAATTTVLATLTLQVAALVTSLGFMGVLTLRGGHVLGLSAPAYGWAAAAGLAIGAAEICYFYLFSGVAGSAPIRASVAVPVIVAGTVVLVAAVSHLAFAATLSPRQLVGGALVVAGLLLMVR